MTIAYAYVWYKLMQPLNMNGIHFSGSEWVQCQACIVILMNGAIIAAGTTGDP